MISQEPTRHHYIPEFYTKRWCREKGPLIEWSKPHKMVVPKSVYPKGSGFQYHLYGLRDLEPEEAQVVEETFFKPVDNFAAQALAAMERDGNTTQWTSRLRSGWTRFLLSLEMRTPEDIEIFKKHWPRIYRMEIPEIDARYASIRQAGNPATYAEYLATKPASEIERQFFYALATMIDNIELGNFINAMKWRVLDTTKAQFKLLTSDRPIILTNGLATPVGHLAIPIGPKKVFLATSNTKTEDALLRMTANEMVRNINFHVVQRARSCPRGWCSFGSLGAFRTEPGMDQLAAGRLMSGSSLIVAMVSSVM